MRWNLKNLPAESPQNKVTGIDFFLQNLLSRYRPGFKTRVVSVDLLPMRGIVHKTGSVSSKKMIKGVHAMFYSSDASGLRAFLRDKLDLKATDVGGGWLIFDLPEADLGCHPSDEEHGAPSGTADISFYCDNIEQSVNELKSKGVEFKGEIEDHGYGFVTHFNVPGNFSIQLYQPKY